MLCNGSTTACGAVSVGSTPTFRPFTIADCAGVRIRRQLAKQANCFFELIEGFFTKKACISHLPPFHN